MISRRKFIKLMGIVTTMFSTVFSSIVRAAKLSISLDKLEQLKKVDGWMVVKLQDKQFILIRDTETTVKVFDPACTHKKCVVAYNPKAKRMECPCHGSVYNIEGKVLNGPAKNALQAYNAELLDDKIIITVGE